MHVTEREVRDGSHQDDRAPDEEDQTRRPDDDAGLEVRRDRTREGSRALAAQLASQVEEHPVLNLRRMLRDVHLDRVAGWLPGELGALRLRRVVEAPKGIVRRTIDGRGDGPGPEPRPEAGHHRTESTRLAAAHRAPAAGAVVAFHHVVGDDVLSAASFVLERGEG